MKKVFIFYVLTLTTYLSIKNDEIIRKPKKQQKQFEKKNITREKTIEGIEYYVTQTGSGPQPNDGQMVSIHYTGWLDNNGTPGNKIDSSLDRSLPVTFILGRNIVKGWDAVIRTMQKGTKCRLFIPSDLGYGKYGIPGVVPADANLIFDLELIEIK